jgi:Ca2+-binding EF-hand superfamily protein
MVRLLKRLKGKDEELTEDQEDNVKKYEDYLTTHKIPELFNKLLTNVINDRPEDVKKHLIAQLEKILYLRKNPSMQESSYFTSEDFELMFDSYDIVGEGYVDYACLVQALQVAGVKNPEEILAKDFPQVRTSSHISKPQFALILNQGFQKAGYC